MALVARERLVLSVDPTVDGEVAGLGEALPAGGAGVRLLPGVNPLVHRKAVPCGESLVAGLADEGLDVGVDKPVTPQRLLAAERLPTDLAGKRPAFGVPVDVPAQGRLVDEGLVAAGAAVRLVPRVDPLVVFQHAAQTEAPPTDVARKGTSGSQVIAEDLFLRGPWGLCARVPLLRGAVRGLGAHGL